MVDKWTQKADFGGTARHAAAGFSIGNKGYIGTGHDGTAYRNDFWEYDSSINVWTQKADFGGTGRNGAFGFSIGDKGYIGSGYNGSALLDFWEYDPNTNSWTQKADINRIRRLAMGFSINNRGYMMGGQYWYVNPWGGGWWNLIQDLWEYNPDTNSWTQRATLPTSSWFSGYGGCFSLNNKGYAVTREGSCTVYARFYEYDPDTNSWTRKADMSITRTFAVGFSIDNMGYIGTGYPNRVDFWEYDPDANSWTRKTNFGGGAVRYSIGFSIGSKGYIGTGYTGSNVKWFWEWSSISYKIHGNVYDGYHNAMPLNKIILFNINTFVKQITHTDENGYYEFEPSDPGMYKVRAGAEEKYGVLSDAISDVLIDFSLHQMQQLIKMADKSDKVKIKGSRVSFGRSGLV